MGAWLSWIVLPSAAWADLDYRLKVQVISEVDTNADRREGHDGHTDGASRFLLRGSLTHTPDPSNVIHVRLDLGGKKFFQENAEDIFVSSGTLVLQHRLTSGLFVGLEGYVKDRRERVSETDYFLGQGSASLRWDFARRLSLRFRAGYGGFLFKPDDFNFGYLGDEYSLALTAEPAQRVRLTTSYGFGRRSYQAYVLRPRPGSSGLQVDPDFSTRRDDLVHTVDLGVRLLRGILVDGGYTFQAITSNSSGFSYLRHRLSAQVSLKIPGDLFLHLAGALQFLSFRDKVFLDTSLYIEDDNRNWVAVRLSRDIGKGFSLEASYSFYASTFSADAVYYRRHVAGLGVAYSL